MFILNSNIKLDQLSSFLYREVWLQASLELVIKLAIKAVI